MEFLLTETDHADAEATAERVRVAVAEVYDGLQRAYPARPHCTAEEALSQIQGRAGHQFDPAVVETLAKYLAEQHTLHRVRLTFSQRDRQSKRKMIR